MPLLVVVVSAFLAWQVDQVSELLLIAAMGETEWFVMALVTVAALGLSAWYSTRTIYRFKWPGVSHQGIQKKLARWLPRPYSHFCFQCRLRSPAWVSRKNCRKERRSSPPQSWCPESLCLLESGGATRRLLPALFLNTTIVDDGRRLLQHPFDAISEFEVKFPGSVDGTEWFPAPLPLSSAALNSALFTLVSPAGTVEKRESGLQIMGRVVDGGDFENSGTTTSASLIAHFRELHPTARIGAIHISNDVAVGAFMAPGPDNRRPDQCPAENRQSNGPPAFRGEALAPPIALLYPDRAPI